MDGDKDALGGKLPVAMAEGAFETNGEGHDILGEDVMKTFGNGLVRLNTFHGIDDSF